MEDQTREKTCSQTNPLLTNNHKEISRDYFNLVGFKVRISDTWFQGGEMFLVGVEEAVEGIVGRLQVKQHLAHLIIIQFV